MIHEERTKLMTKLALYESKEGKKELQITRYFPGDYVGARMLGSFLCGTLAFAIVVGLCAMYDIENLMINLFGMDILEFARNILIIYIIFISIYLCICYAYFTYSYGKYKGRVNKYLMRMKELYKQYVHTEK